MDLPAFFYTLTTRSRSASQARILPRSPRAVSYGVSLSFIGTIPS
jgi:hypothetical protein